MKYTTLVPLVALIALAGCSHTSYVGKWKGKLDLGEDKQTTPAKNDMEQAGRDMGKAFAKGLSSMMSADLELKSDNTYSMTILFISVEGNYLVSGDTVTLTPAKIMGKTIAQIQAESKDPQKNNMIQPMVLKAASDGKSLKLQDSKAEPGALVFTRETETK